MMWMQAGSACDNADFCRDVPDVQRCVNASALPDYQYYGCLNKRTKTGLFRSEGVIARPHDWKFVISPFVARYHHFDAGLGILQCDCCARNSSLLRVLHESDQRGILGKRRSRDQAYKQKCQNYRILFSHPILH